MEIFIAEATIAVIYTFAGRDLLARSHFDLASVQVSNLSDQGKSLIGDALFIKVQTINACNLFSCGFFDSALSLGTKMLAELSVAKDYVTVILPTLSGLVALFEWCHNWDCLAEIYNIFIKRSAGQSGFTISAVFAVLNSKLLINSGNADEAVRLLQGFLTNSGSLVFATYLYSPLVTGLMRQQRYDEALDTIEQALDYEAKLDSSGFQSEFLLLKAEVLISAAAPQLSAAETTIRLALAAAQRQPSLFRELNAAMALAALLESLGRSAEGLAVLEPVYARFTEGFQTPNLKEAAGLLDRIRSGLQ